MEAADGPRKPTSKKDGKSGCENKPSIKFGTMIKTTPSSFWSVITSVEPGVSPQYLHKDEVTLWMTRSKNGRHITFWLQQFSDHAFSRLRKGGEMKVLTIKQTKNKTNATTITKKGDFEVIVDSQLLSDANNNQITIEKHKVEVNVDNVVIFLTHCKSKDGIYIPYKVLNDYEVLGSLTQTNYSKLYRIKRKNDDKNEIQVVKVERESKCHEAVLLNEIEMLKKVSHDNIIKLISADTTPLQRNLIVECASGGNLKRYINNNKCPNEAGAKQIFKQILSGLAYLHQNNIVHRDIKPENIVLMSKNSLASVKIIDFGLSCDLPRDGQISDAVGTFYYMSPTVMDNFIHKRASPYTDKTDVWSFGVTLYSFLNAGKLPFLHHPDRERYCLEVMEHNVRVNHGEFLRLSSTARRVILSCLEHFGCMRPSTAELQALYVWFQT